MTCGVPGHSMFVPPNNPTRPEFGCLDGQDATAMMIFRPSLGVAGISNVLAMRRRCGGAPELCASCMRASKRLAQQERVDNGS